MTKAKLSDCISQPLLKAGQLWRMVEVNLEVETVGRLLVHYKLGKPKALHISKSCSSIKSVMAYPNQPLNPEKSHEYFQKKLRSDFGNWIQDGLRHSFGTYYHNLRRDIPEVVYVMGNSVGIAKKHYVREVTKEWNDKFWTLKPTP